MAAKTAFVIFFLTTPFVISGVPFLGVTIALGALAGALSETDDHPRGRIKSLILKVICFAVSSLCVELLRTSPLYLCGGLIFGTIFFLLVGGLGERYRGVTFGAILVGLYTMLNSSSSPAWFWQPILLSSGALFFGLLSLYILRKSPYRPLDEHLARGYMALSKYLELKSQLFPSAPENLKATRNKLAIRNVKVVNALDCCRDVLTSYIGEVDENPKLKKYLQYFMLLQNLHEKASSSHDRYDLLSTNSAHKTLIEGIGQTIHLMSRATKLFAKSLLLKTEYEHPISLGWMTNVLSEKINDSESGKDHPLAPIIDNLSASHNTLKNIAHDSGPSITPRLRKDTRSLLKRFTDQLHFNNPRLRHAIRLSLCFLFGFLIAEWLQLEKGVWILLTCLFVCQPTYSDTRRRLLQRIIGTISGVIIGVLLIHLLPTMAGHLLLLLVSVYSSFIWQQRRNSLAVLFITIFVLTAFDCLTGRGMAIMLPRIFDTLIGTILAFASVRLLWPNWQYRRLPSLLVTAISANCSYLEEILMAFQLEKADDYSYRFARRAAHRADNALVLAWQDMQVEAKEGQRFREHAFTLTFLNHALLSYLSAFGAQREQQVVLSPEIRFFTEEIVTALKDTSSSICTKNPNSKRELMNNLESLRDRIHEKNKLLHSQQLTVLYNISKITGKLIKTSSKLIDTAQK